MTRATRAGRRTAASEGPTEGAEAVADLVERLAATFTQAGFPRLPARVFSALLTSQDGRMSAAQLAERLRVSAGSVSSAVGYLETVRMIHREREPGSRRDVYVVRDDAWHDTMLAAGRIYEPFVRVIAEGVDVVGRGTRAGDRLALSVEFLEFLTDEMAGIARRWEARRAAGSP